MRASVLLIFSLIVIVAAGEADAQENCGDAAGWISVHPLAQNARAAQFHRALSQHENKLLALYPEVSQSQYSALSRLAFAIMGAESKYYQSWRYFLKSWTPSSAVKIAKCLRRGQCGSEHLLSSGPTQIKEIPVRVQIEFGVTPDSLFQNPAHASIATMAFLLELREYILDLKIRYPVVLAGMNEANMSEYLVYFYQGKGRRVLQGEAPDPKKNVYLASVHEHLRAIRSNGSAGGVGGPSSSAVDCEIQVSRWRGGPAEPLHDEVGAVH